MNTMSKTSTVIPGMKRDEESDTKNIVKKGNNTIQKKRRMSQCKSITTIPKNNAASTPTSKTMMQRMQRKLELEQKRRTKQCDDLDAYNSEMANVMLNETALAKKTPMKRGRKSIQDRKRKQTKINNSNFTTLFNEHQGSMTVDAYLQKRDMIQTDIIALDTQENMGPGQNTLLNEKKMELLQLNDLFDKIQFDAPKLLLQYCSEVKKLIHTDRNKNGISISLTCPVYFDTQTLSMKEMEINHREHEVVALGDSEFGTDSHKIYEDTGDDDHDDDVSHVDPDNDACDGDGDNYNAVNIGNVYEQLRVYQLVAFRQLPVGGLRQLNETDTQCIESNIWHKYSSNSMTTNSPKTELFMTHIDLCEHGITTIQKVSSSVPVNTKPLMDYPQCIHQPEPPCSSSTKETITRTRKRPLSKKPPYKPPSHSTSDTTENADAITDYYVCINPMAYTVDVMTQLKHTVKPLPREQFNLIHPKRGMCRYSAKLCGMKRNIKRHETWIVHLNDMIENGVICNEEEYKCVVMMYYEPELEHVINNLTLTIQTTDDNHNVIKQSFSGHKHFQTSSIMKKYLDLVTPQNTLYVKKSDQTTASKRTNKNNQSTCTWMSSDPHIDSNICTSSAMNFSFRGQTSVAVAQRGSSLDSTSGYPNSEKLRNWDTYLNEKQGKETLKIPDYIKEKISSHIKRCSYSKNILKNKDTWRAMLKQNGIVGWYKHVHKLMLELGGIQPITLSAHEQQILNNDYANMLKAFERYRGDRHNIVFSDLMYNVLCEAHGWYHLIDKDRYMKSSKNLNENLTILKKMLVDIGLTAHNN